MQPRAGVLTSIGLVAFAACDGQTSHSPETARQYEWADVAHTNEVIPECFPEDPVRVARICDMALQVDAFLVLGVDELTQVTEPLIFNGEEMAPEECGSVGNGDWATGTQIWSHPQIPDDQAFFLSGLPDWFDIVGKAVILPVWLNEDGAFVQGAEPLAMTNGHLVEPPCVNWSAEWNGMAAEKFLEKVSACTEFGTVVPADWRGKLRVGAACYPPPG